MELMQLALILGTIFGCTNGLMFHLTPNTKKCLKEEIHKDVLVTGEYEISDGPGQKANLGVSTGRGWAMP